MEFSIVIPAYNRCDSLRRLLASIAENFDRRETAYEVLIANNAREPKARTDIAALAFRARHRQQGASRYLYKRPALPSIAGNLLRALGAYGCYSLCRVVRKKYRAKGRIFHYSAMLEQALKRAQAAQPRRTARQRELGS